MTHTRKVDLLYRRAKGQGSDITPAEAVELRRYRVDFNEGDFYATKANISAYVKAVDNQGCHISFYDWCMNNNLADRRRSGSSKKDMKKAQHNFSFGMMFLGFITWGAAAFTVLGDILPGAACLIIGALLALVLGRASRRSYLLTNFLLPIVVIVLASMYL